MPSPLWRQDQILPHGADESTEQGRVFDDAPSFETIAERIPSSSVMTCPSSSTSAMYCECSPRLSASLFLPLENLDLVTLCKLQPLIYSVALILIGLDDLEISALPLTYDYQANPLRSNPHGSEYLHHAILASSMQYISRMRACDHSKALEQRAAAYRHSATRLCALAPATASGHVKHQILDTTVILFALDVSLKVAQCCNCLTREIVLHLRLWAVEGSLVQCLASVGIFGGHPRP